MILLMRQTTNILAVWETEATEFPDGQESHWGQMHQPLKLSNERWVLCVMIARIRCSPMWPLNPLTQHNTMTHTTGLSCCSYLLKQKKITDVFPFPMISMLSGLSLALNKEGCDWQDRHSARANSGRAAHRSQTRYTPLVEVNQAIKAWSF